MWDRWQTNRHSDSQTSQNFKRCTINSSHRNTEILIISTTTAGAEAQDPLCHSKAVNMTGPIKSNQCSFQSKMSFLLLPIYSPAPVQLWLPPARLPSLLTSSIVFFPNNTFSKPEEWERQGRWLWNEALKRGRQEVDTGLSFPNGIRASETDLLIRTLCAISSSSHTRGSEHYGKVKPWWAKRGIDSLITPKHAGWALKEMTGLFTANSAAQGREVTRAVTLLYIQPNVHSFFRRTDILRGVTAYGITKFVKSTRRSWMGSAFFFHHWLSPC